MEPGAFFRGVAVHKAGPCLKWPGDGSGSPESKMNLKDCLVNAELQKEIG